MREPDKIEAIRENPQHLYDLSPREFEEVVAELLASFGWDVSLTPPTRDGGHDILGISRDSLGLETAWAVECKRYRRGRRVGVDVVRNLYGVKHGLGLPQALLVTTSSLTRDAKQFADSVGDIKVADWQMLVDWLERYKRAPGEAPHVTGKHFQSCFLSYSHRDEAFASQLVARLRSEGVRVWFAAEDLNPGQKIHEEVGKAIDNFDRLVVVLSEHSMRSPWVQSEVRKARRREVRDACRVLFPISLVSFDTLKQWELFDADSGQDLAVEIREYLIPDFSRWRDAAVFETQTRALLSGLGAASSPGAARRGTSTFSDGDWITAAILAPERVVIILQRVATSVKLRKNASRQRRIEEIEAAVGAELSSLRQRYEAGGETDEGRCEACIAKTAADIIDREMISYRWNLGEKGDGDPVTIFRETIRRLMERNTG